MDSLNSLTREPNRRNDFATKTLMVLIYLLAVSFMLFVCAEIIKQVA